MGASASKVEITPALLDGLLDEYRQKGGITDQNTTAGWREDELRWFLTAFVGRYNDVNMIREVEEAAEAEEEAAGHKPTKGSSKAKLARSNSKKKKAPTLQEMALKKGDVMKYVVVFNQCFVNYPSLFDRFWNLVGTEGGDGTTCNFFQYMTFLFKASRGAWDDRMWMAFNLFDKERHGTMRLGDVMDTVTEISEFICNVARGVLTMKEFNYLKLQHVERLFAGTAGELTLEEFSKVAEHHQALLGCTEILDMVFGRVVKKMEKDLKRNRVFGRHLQETALGEVKDITGEMPFVPEVIASAIAFLRQHNALGTPELFRISVSQEKLVPIMKALNKGITLKSILRAIPKPNSDDYMMIAVLIKTYCREMVEPAFTNRLARKFIIVQESDATHNKILEDLKDLFSRLPKPNRYFLSALLLFLKDVSKAQMEQGGSRGMTSPNLGVVFAPCTMYDPADPAFGALSAPLAFTTLIDHAEEFTSTIHAPDEGNTANHYLRLQLQQIKKECDDLKASFEGKKNTFGVKIQGL